MGHRRQQFKKGTKDIDPKAIDQVSMDGPATNWGFHNDLVKDWKTEKLTELLMIGHKSDM